MTATRELHDAGQSLWLDSITRELLTSGKLQDHIERYSVTGLTSNPSIFDKAIERSRAYDPDITQGLARGDGAEDIFFRLAIADLQSAADLFSPDPPMR
jgi:transaldolase